MYTRNDVIINSCLYAVFMIISSLLFMNGRSSEGLSKAIDIH